MSRNLTVDEWLRAEEPCEVLFELSTVVGRDDLVRVTPWLRAIWPLASFALDLPKTSIAAVRPAVEGMASHPRLAHLEFRPGSAITLDDLYRQIEGRVLTDVPAAAIVFVVARGDVRRIQDFMGADLAGLVAPRNM